MAISAEEVLAEIGPVQEILDAHDGVVTVLDTSDGNIMLSLDGGCTGCSSTPMTAMQIYYSLKKLENVLMSSSSMVNFQSICAHLLTKKWPRKLLKVSKNLAK